MALETAKQRKVNPVKAYFSNFGLKQTADMLILASVITIIVGLCLITVFVDINWVMLAGGAVYALGVLINLGLCAKTLITVKNHKSPHYRQAFVNLFISIVLLILAVLVVVYSIV